MNRLALSNGLIAFGGNEGMGKTRFTLKLANFLARSEKVLFLSYQDYSERLITLISEMDGFINDSLEINTFNEYYGVGAFLELKEYIEANPVDTLFIDDITCFNRNEFHEFSEKPKDDAIRSLLHLSSHLNKRLIFNIDICPAEKNNIPRIRDFNWSRRIINDCSQIIAINRPIVYGVNEDEHGESVVDRIEIYNLKNKTHQEEIIRLDDREMMIYKTIY